jgi:hypothetical protein
VFRVLQHATVLSGSLLPPFEVGCWPTLCKLWGDLLTLATAFMMTVSGFVEVVSRAFLREQTISELFSKEGDA